MERIIDASDNIEIIAKLADLGSRWNQRKAKFRYPHFIDTKLRKLEQLLAPKASKPEYDDFASMFDDMVQPDASLSNITDLVNQGEQLDYETLLKYEGSHNRLEVFEDCCDTFTDKQYWPRLRDAYQMQDRRFISFITYFRLFGESRNWSERFMTLKERRALKALPDQIIISRGMSVTEYESAYHGISWTTDQTVAQFFASRKVLREGPKVVKTMTIDKSDVFAYILDRSESEIIYLGPTDIY